MSTTTVLLYIFLGSASLSYLTYGKRQHKALALSCGIALALIPYFDLSLWLMLLLALGIMALPFVVHQINQK